LFVGVEFGYKLLQKLARNMPYIKAKLYLFNENRISEKKILLKLYFSANEDDKNGKVLTVAGFF